MYKKSLTTIYGQIEMQRISYLVFLYLSVIVSISISSGAIGFTYQHMWCDCSLLKMLNMLKYHQFLGSFISLIELLYNSKHVTGSNNSSSYTLPMITRPKLCCLCGRMPLAICVLKNKNNIENTLENNRKMSSK